MRREPEPFLTPTSSAPTGGDALAIGCLFALMGGLLAVACSADAVPTSLAASLTGLLGALAAYR